MEDNWMVNLFGNLFKNAEKFTNDDKDSLVLYDTIELKTQKVEVNTMSMWWDDTLEYHTKVKVNDEIFYHIIQNYNTKEEAEQGHELFCAKLRAEKCLAFYSSVESCLRYIE